MFSPLRNLDLSVLRSHQAHLLKDLFLLFAYKSFEIPPVSSPDLSTSLRVQQMEYNPGHTKILSRNGSTSNALWHVHCRQCRGRHFPNSLLHLSRQILGRSLGPCSADNT